MPVFSCIDLNKEELDELSAMVWQVLDNAVKRLTLTLPTEPECQTLKQNAATFVTLYVSGELKGCIGCYQAKQPLWRDVCTNAYSSAFQDYRFNSLTADDLNYLTIDVSILSELLPMENFGERALLEQLVPEQDGLLLKEGYSRAIFLPSVWHSLPTARQFVTALKQKAGWEGDYWSQGIEVFGFRAQLYHLPKP